MGEPLLTQREADALIKMDKQLMPLPGQSDTVHASKGDLCHDLQ
jgi:hypothetical protein